MSGMTKLILSNSVPDAVQAGMRLVEDPKVLEKSASTIFGMDYEDMKPDKDHVGIHLVGLGDFETYGSNRNADAFPKFACAKYHDTFVKHGHVYRHHRNKDPKKALGQIVKSAYNENMGRVELFIHAHKEKARDELHKLASEGTSSFSMACRVPYDRCNICGTLRKTASDPNQCDHVRHSLGDVRRDGSMVCVHNDKPTFFDISFVNRPADRIAWDLKVASASDIDSVKLAEVEGIWVPDSIAMASDYARERFTLMQKLADAQNWYAAPGHLKTAAERRMWELRKAASVELSDSEIDMLRTLDPADLMAKLARNGIILSAPQFFKYAFGPDGGEIAGVLPEVLDYIEDGMFRNLVKSGNHQRACTDTYFSVDPAAIIGYFNSHNSVADCFVSGELRKKASFIDAAAEQRVIDRTIEGFNPVIRDDGGRTKVASAVSPVVEECANIYAAYKLSAVQAVKKARVTDEETLIALAAVQDMV